MTHNEMPKDTVEEKLNVHKDELTVIKSCLLSLAFAIEEGRIDGVVEEIQYTLGHIKRLENLTPLTRR